MEANIKKWFIVGGVAVAALGMLMFLHAGPVPLAEAVSEGTANVSVTGVNIESLEFTINAQGPVRIVIPAGTMLASRDPGTQNMMTAQTIVVTFDGESDVSYGSLTQTFQVPVYCINRHLEAPTPVSAFTLGAVTEETEPVQKLAQCLEGLDASHREKQYAIWSVSDKFIRMNEDEFLNTELETVRTDMQRQGGEGLADKIEREIPDVQPEILALFRSLSGEELDEAFEYMRPDFLAEKRKEFATMRDAARPLLERCGYAVDTLPLFAGTP
jgi:hypothetical protein